METDAVSGIAELMGYLINQGHSRIGYIGAAPELKIQHDRLNAYRRGLAAASIFEDASLEMLGDLTPQGGYTAAGCLLDIAQPPTAIVCINDLTAIGAMHAAHEHGLVVGRDIAVAGFDGIADAAHTQPALTTLDQPVYSIAVRLVEMLLAVMSGNGLPTRQVKIQPTLLVRDSTGA